MRTHSLRWHFFASFFGTLVSWTGRAQAAPTDIPSAASFFVPTLPGLHQDESQRLHIYSGHLSSDPNVRTLPTGTVSAHLFFVLLKARRVADKERIIFWFNGGPGCSSFDGLFLESGPFRVDGNGGIRTIGGWEEYTTMVFVDQPAGTGFSYTATDRYVHELTDAAGQVVQFMRNFYSVFPEYKSMDTYVAGESYAGQYIPYIADAILSSNINIPLKGLAIGNGWFDARSQYPAYLDYAVKHGILEEKSDAWKEVKQETDDCLIELQKFTTPEPISVEKCEGLVTSVAMKHTTTIDGNEMCMNVYDVRGYDLSPFCGMNWPFELANVTQYLGRTDVKKAFHAEAKSESWVECSGRVGQELWNRVSESSITLMPSVIERVPVMLYAGDQDFICNYVGIENMIQSMVWNGAKGLGTVETKSWSVDNVPAGTWVESRNLTYVKIFNSSHMVPYDVPVVSHDMMLRFMGVNFSALTDGSARIPSKVGDEEKPIPTLIDSQKDSAAIPVPPGKSPEQDKAMWEAYYNAGSAALVLFLIALAVGLFVFCRNRRRTGKVSLASKDAEESIPLHMGVGNGSDVHADVQNGNGHYKGKGRADDIAIFDVGSDDEGEYHDDHKQKS